MSKEPESPSDKIESPRGSSVNYGPSIPFLKPAWVKKADNLSKGVRKFVQYNQDLMEPAKIAQVSELREKFDQAVKRRDKVEAEAAEKEMVAVCEKSVSNYKSSALKENIEVIIVAIVVALGIRAYFLQPFKIPTASMQPTLNGIVARSIPESEAFPNPLTRGLQYLTHGRNYVEMRVPQDWGTVQLVEVRQRSKLHFFTVTDLVFQDSQRQQRVLTGYLPTKQLLENLWTGPHLSVTEGGKALGREESFTLKVVSPPVAGGTLLARGRIDTGDQVLVNKMAYHFRSPERGEVFVFNTKGITGIENPPGVESQHYIKRLVGLPGNRLQLTPTGGTIATKNDSARIATLKLDGETAKEPGMQRVMAAQDGYRGYTTMPAGGLSFGFARPDGKPMETLQDEIQLAPKKYMAMGDNSPESSDSRYWGPVPEENLVGPALFVYWPFLPHFGIIR